MTTDRTTDTHDKDLLLKVFEEQMAILPPMAKEFCRQRFTSHTDIIPWILRDKATKDLHCDESIIDDVAIFIARIRIMLDTAGAIDTLRQEYTPKQNQRKGPFSKIKAFWNYLTKTPSIDYYDDMMEEIARNRIESEKEEEERKKYVQKPLEDKKLLTAKKKHTESIELSSQSLKEELERFDKKLKEITKYLQKREKERKKRNRGI